MSQQADPNSNHSRHPKASGLRPAPDVSGNLPHRLRLGRLNMGRDATPWQVGRGSSPRGKFRLSGFNQTCAGRGPAPQEEGSTFPAFTQTKAQSW